LRLPVAATLPVVVAEPQPPAPPAPRPAAILVVEDDPEVAALVTELLVTFGHLPTRVASIEAALGALGNGRELDLVFSDVMLPGGGSGLDLAHEISRRRPELPILLTTGSGGEMTAPIESMPWPLLRKPFRPEELRTALEGALGQVSPEAWGNRESDGHAQRVLTQRQELAALRAENTALKQEIAELQRRLGMGSSNSSKPPASDGLGKKPRIAASLPSVSGKLRAPAHRVTASNAARSKRT
jgi:CheY-like chemotaxis protein